MATLRAWWQKRKIRQLLKKGDELYSERQFAKALAALQAADVLAKTVNAWHLSAQALEAQGNIHRVMGQKTKAEVCFRGALEYKERIGDTSGASALRSTLGSAPVMGINLLRDDSIFCKGPKTSETLPPDKAHYGITGFETALPHHLARLREQVKQLHKQGQYRVALPLAERLVHLTQQTLGKTNFHSFQSLNDLGELYRVQGVFQRAETIFLEALEICEQIRGSDHPDSAVVLSNLALTYIAQSKYEEAERLFLQALAINERQLGPNHPGTAASLNNLGGIYFEQKIYDQAELFFSRALTIQEQKLGSHHLHVSSSLENLASVYREQGFYEKAEPLFRRALAIREQVLGANHPDVATSLNNIGGMHEQQGVYEKAEPLFRRALAIREQVLGANHPDTASTLGNLGRLYNKQGFFLKAEPYLLRALVTYEQVLGPDHSITIAILNNLAKLYQVQGFYEKAESFFLKALKATEKNLGSDHEDTAICLNELAILYRAQGDYDKANSLYRQALVIIEQRLGPDHLNTAIILQNLAVLYLVAGLYDEAEIHILRALEIIEQRRGPDHPDTAVLFTNLAWLYNGQGLYERAEPLLQQALAIREQKLGLDHPDTAKSLNSLARLLAGTNRTAESFDFMARAAMTDDLVIGQGLTVGSENRRTVYLQTLRGNFATFLSLICQHFQSSQLAIQAAIDLTLRRKSIGAETLASQQVVVLSGQYPDLASQLYNLTILRREIAQRTLAGPGLEGLAEHQRLLAEWIARKEQGEAELARHIPEMHLERQIRDSNRHIIARGLPPGGVLLEFVRFDVFDFHAVPAKNEKYWRPAHYLAFVMAANDPENVHMVDLGEAKHVEEQIVAFRQYLQKEQQELQGEQPQQQEEQVLGQHRTLKPEKKSKPVIPQDEHPNAAGLSLRAAVFDPLVLALGNSTQLFIAPDGELTLLPFHVLPFNDGRLLMDTYQITYLSTGRDVLRFSATSDRTPNDPVVIADPDFDLTASPATDSNVTETVTPRVRGGDADISTNPHQSKTRVSRDFDRKKRFERLPSTRYEGEQIGTMLGVQPWLGNAALKEPLQEQNSPAILHIATHGFFETDQESDPNRRQHYVEASFLPLSAPGMENPMLRSGIVLAGANAALAKQAVPPGVDNGLLTAEDVSGMNLLDTELVVLSACQTGLGDVQVGEGVFGLRRAFIIAGAKTLVMSLWKVPDVATAILMEQFYHNLLTHHLRRDEALRKAQEYVRTMTVGAFRAQWLTPEAITRFSQGNPDIRKELEDLARQSDDHRPFTHPYFWGAFICLGNPAPLPPHTRQHRQ